MQITFVPDATLYPFASRWFDSSAGRVHYIDEGAGPTILFCHGAPTWSFLYRRIVRALRDRFRCVAVDHLGFGLSERPTGFGYTVAEHTAVLGELIDHLRLEDFVVMGHDWGGPIGLGAASARADRVRGIVTWSSVRACVFRGFGRCSAISRWSSCRALGISFRNTNRTRSQ